MTVPFTRTSSSRSEDSSPVAGAYVDRSPLRRSIDEESHDRLFLDDEELQLTEGTAAALAQFQQEKDEADSKPDAHLFEEKWGMSQFWYSDETSSIVAREAVGAALGGGIACLACPSLFQHLRAEAPGARTHLLEYDPRFEVLGNFSLYDYKLPLDLSPELHHSFQVVVADPPYLSDECLEKTVQTMQLLGCHEGATFILLTGACMRDKAFQLLRLRPVMWRPQHKAKLGNDFMLYTTARWVADHLGGWDKENDPSTADNRQSMESCMQALSRSSLGSNRSSQEAWNRRSIDGSFNGNGNVYRTSIPPQSPYRRSSFTGYFGTRS